VHLSLVPPLILVLEQLSPWLSDLFFFSISSFYLIYVQPDNLFWFMCNIVFAMSTTVWHYVCSCVLSKFEFFLLKLSVVCTFWIVLMCLCQKWFLKNEKISLAYISARKAIWKATATTLSNTLLTRCLILLIGKLKTLRIKIDKAK